MIAEGLDVPLSEVYGVATFYCAVHPEPQGQVPDLPCVWAPPATSRARGDVLDAVQKKLGIDAGGMHPPTASSRWTPAAASAPAAWPRS